MEGKEEKESKQMNPLVIIGLLIGIFIVVGVGIYFISQYQEKVQDEKELTQEEVIDYVNPEEIGYDGYVNFFERHEIKPIANFVYNIDIPEEERAAIDPFYNDPYVGYLYSGNVKASLFPTDDGQHIFLLYDVDTNEVLSNTKWDDNVDLTLQIYQTTGKKAELTKEAYDSKDEATKENKIQEIQKLNDELSEMYEQLNQSLERH